MKNVADNYYYYYYYYYYYVENSIKGGKMEEKCAYIIPQYQDAQGNILIIMT